MEIFSRKSQLIKTIKPNGHCFQITQKKKTTLRQIFE